MRAYWRRTCATGDDQHSPWPVRVDYRTGEARGPIAANMSYNLRLFDKLIEHGYTEFREPRAKLWDWIKNYQIPNLAKDGSLWVQFFEDHGEAGNRNAWSPLNLARYLIEKREALDPDWKVDAKALIDFTALNFTSVRDGVPGLRRTDLRQEAVGRRAFHLWRRSWQCTPRRPGRSNTRRLRGKP